MYRNEKAGGTGLGLRCRAFVKQRKNRLERRRAKLKPDCAAGYGRYRGWLT